MLENSETRQDPSTAAENTPKNAWPVDTILRLKKNNTIAAALRKAGSPATTYYALPYVSFLWAEKPWQKKPVLALTYLISSTNTTQNTEGGGLGFTAAKMQPFGYHSMETKLLRTQTQTLEQTLTDFSYILSTAQKHHVGTNWNAVWYALQKWDHPNRKIRTETRQKVLEEYYQTLYFDQTRKNSKKEPDTE